MTSLADLTARAAYDPLVRAALVAAGVLLLAAVAGGLARRDASALARPVSWIALAAALLSALVLATAGDVLAADSRLARLAGGWERLPLYLLAIGYGPSLGIVAGVAVALVRTGPFGVTASDLALLLELAVVGWLALGPTPRRVRWAGPIAAVLGWGLATATLDLAAWAADGRPIEVGPFAMAHAPALPGVLAAGLLAALTPPTWWRRRVPGAAEAVRAEGDEERERRLRPLLRPRRPQRARRPSRWPRPPAPLPLARAGKRRRRLGPPPVPRALERPGSNDDVPPDGRSPIRSS